MLIQIRARLVAEGHRARYGHTRIPVGGNSYSTGAERNFIRIDEAKFQHGRTRECKRTSARKPASTVSAHHLVASAGGRRIEVKGNGRPTKGISNRCGKVPCNDIYPSEGPN